MFQYVSCAVLIAYFGIQYIVYVHYKTHKHAFQNNAWKDKYNLYSTSYANYISSASHLG